MELKDVQISDSLEGIARIGAISLKNVSNGAVSSALRERIDEFASELRSSMLRRRPSELESVQATRALYRQVGLDPTKDRPSSERLLRRVLANRPIPKINKLVDAMNLVSLQHQMPIGIYDSDTIVPPILVRIGRPDEGYEGISGDRISAAGRLVLVGGEGPFGNPSQDSARTAVTLRTVRAFGIVWGPYPSSREQIERVLADMAAQAAEFCDAKLVASGIL